jgi:tyrosine-specific transport protein
MLVNKTLGAMLVVTGTTIGAGMLALPMTSARFGFKESVMLMVVMWAVMAYTALITLRLNQHYGKACSIVYISEKNFGRLGKAISLFALCLLFYALLAAYMTGGASLLASTFPNIHLNRSQWILIFFGVFGGIVISHIKMLDHINRILVLTMVAVFCYIVNCILPHVTTQNLNHSVDSMPYLSVALPVFFTSFGFHGSIPTVVNYLGVTHKGLKRTFFVGSIIPLGVYIVWQMATLGVLTPDVATCMNPDQDLGQFINAVSASSHAPEIRTLINCFAFLAIATSFLGVGIGFLDFMIELRSKNPCFKERFLSGAIIMIPSLLFALFYPEGFVLALGYAAIALSLLAVILPTLNMLKINQSLSIIEKMIIMLVFFIGLGIIGVEIYNKIS